MIPEGFKTVEKMGISEMGFPYVTFGNDLTFYGLPMGTREDNLKYIISDVRVRHLSERKHVQHAHYIYQPGDTVIEIGAFLGYYAMWIALQVGPTGRVIAIEMIPEYCAILKENLKPFPHAEVVEKGVGSYRGKGKAYAGVRQTSGMRKDVVAQYNDTISEIEIEIDTVDNILADIELVDMAIIQVNGAELDVLAGMSETLPKIRNVAIASQYDEGGVNHIKAVSDILGASGFVVHDDGVVVYGGRRCVVL